MGMTSDQKDNMMHSENQLCASQMNLLHSHAFKKGVWCELSLAGSSSEENDGTRINQIENNLQTAADESQAVLHW